MAKYNIYAVGYGVDKETNEPVYGLKFPTWDECKPFVVGVDGAKYKGFLTDKEADVWLEKTIDSIMGRGEAEVVKNDVFMNTLFKDNPTHKRFEEFCDKNHIPVSEMLLVLEAQFLSLNNELDTLTLKCFN